ncbi:hypothetical protein [Fulvivirga lutea]|uniref:hypothetical protein n=1 Tax=Fulvivirga lutea TaxID=2810512 RepID=UPI001F3FEBBA|nr:hypothetical protein [Fulvivirga lutea]
MDQQITQVLINKETFFKISDVDQLRPFFMSIVSDSNHWMFIGSNGGLTAGRKNSEYALFPYYTDDKIIESAENTGSKTIIRINTESGLKVWEPFSVRFYAQYKLTRNLYKSAYGNKILFEEVNQTLGLTFQYEWNTSKKFGFVRKSRLQNNSNSKVQVEVIDGIQNIIPFGVGSAIQDVRSNLVDAYKRSELNTESGIGIFALSAIIVDRAEPSEALKANIAWSVGLENCTHLLSSKQLNNFRKGSDLIEETDVKAEKGAYLISASIELQPNADKNWLIVANVNNTISAIVALNEQLKNSQQLLTELEKDIEAGTNKLIQLNASSDALQITKDGLRDARHFSNTLFNIMRGGIFDDDYRIDKDDFCQYIKKANKEVFKNNQKYLESLEETISLDFIKKLEKQTDDSDLKRLSLEYLPLKFSRRHGDPSRPWNQFSINTHNEDGSKILDYEGNWRDIFQNWEALAHSYPEFIDGMIFRFLNASTFDGYNPYRITKDGIDWEKIEPDDPWSYIGYWGDHQIIYLLKFLEISENHYPGNLNKYFNDEIFVYANVPYRIKSYDQILANPKDTIDFDEQADHEIEKRHDKIGADSSLLLNQSGAIHKVNLIEKLLASVLAKISNFIPEGGIWMNTQRPEWNDANNALVGNGVSMVTLYYLYRFLKFLNNLLPSESNSVKISSELVTCFKGIQQGLMDHEKLLKGNFDDVNRKKVTDSLGRAASDFRGNIYNSSFSGSKSELTVEELKTFVSTALKYLEHTIKANKRDDNMYHAYNIMSVKANGISIEYLDEMLEGQVAVLSSKYLNPNQALEVLDALKSSALFRPDQYSYLLYPNKNLPGFLEKNNIPQAAVEKSELLNKLISEGNTRIIEQDVKGQFHFNGNFKNANDLKTALEQMQETDFANLVKKDGEFVLEVFEEVFNHKEFTGRSGTFFGYEGLGSIYWHMVSKLSLATQECCLEAIELEETAETIGRLLEHYYEINEGIGVHKSPELYGAFPTDPYSHTPMGKGAQQPGMTGQVKEDILSRFGELGIKISQGKISFEPVMLRKNEFLTQEKMFEYYDLNSNLNAIPIPKNALAFTYCQIPIVYKISDANQIKIYADNGPATINGLTLDKAMSHEIFKRSGTINKVEVAIEESILK